jgi:ABC-type glutathione transport system ATPase component
MMGKPTDEEDNNRKEVQAEDNSLAVGDIRVGGNTGNINISNVTHIYNTAKEEASSKREEPAAGESPYMGLRYFDTSDAELFYGREALTHELVERVSKESFLAIVGASGSGKSSVARAGLIPAWKQENERRIVHVITPTVHPLESLAASLTHESESVTATSTLVDDM